MSSYSSNHEFYVVNSVETVEHIYKGEQVEDIPEQISVYMGEFILKDDYYNSITNYIPITYLE